MTDKDLIRDFKSGDFQLFGKLYESLRSEFVGLVKRRFPKFSVEESLSLYNDACTSFYENVINEKITPETLNVSIKTYLFQIGINKGLAILKKEKRFDLYSEFNVETEPLYASSYNDEFEKELKNVEKYLFDMGEPCKTILELYYFHKKKMVEIADFLSYKTADVAKNQKAKCLKRLRSNYKTTL